MKLAIHFGGKEGFVSHDEGSRDVMVTHPNPLVRKAVHSYLTTERDFTVPDGSGMPGGRKLIKGTPSHDRYLLDMAMNELYYNTNVKVNWGHKDNKGYTTKEPVADPNAKADKPILKSVDGSTGYEIIN